MIIIRIMTKIIAINISRFIFFNDFLLYSVIFGGTVLTLGGGLFAAAVPVPDFMF